MTRTAFAILAIATTAKAVPVLAQSGYYAREPLVGLKANAAATTPPVVTPPKAPSCGSLAGNTATPAGSGQTLTYTGTATTIEDAQSMCESAFASSGLTTAACTWVNLPSSGAYQKVRLFKPSGIGYNPNATIYGANCTK